MKPEIAQRASRGICGIEWVLVQRGHRACRIHHIVFLALLIFVYMSDGISLRSGQEAVIKSIKTLTKAQIQSLKNADTQLIELMKAMAIERKGSADGNPPFSCSDWVKDRREFSNDCFKHND